MICGTPYISCKWSKIKSSKATRKSDNSLMQLVFYYNCLYSKSIVTEGKKGKHPTADFVILLSSYVKSSYELFSIVEVDETKTAKVHVHY